VNVSAPDRTAQTAALRALLTADESCRPSLAPRVVAVLGTERLRAITEATAARVGGIRDVVDGPAGLAVTGPRGRVPAWVRLDESGAVDELWIAPRLAARITPPVWLSIWTARAFQAAALGWQAVGCWTAADRTGWLGSALTVAFLLLLFEAWSAPATEPWWVRRPLEAAGVASLASAARLPGLPTGHTPAQAGVAAVLLTISAVSLVRARRHQWGETTSAPLPHFPLRGSWYVVQGGGRGLNHHVGHPDQRGALDLVKAGGRRGRALGGYPCYGEPVHAPCAGVVTEAVDGIEDQVPGSIRYAPAYGNHVFIDTGEALVKLAHLRPGSVTVTAGQRVEAGELLGEVGNSGNSTEPHLHLHVERDGRGLDLRFSTVPGRLHRGRTIRA
jgi:hypothetical protein